MMTVINIKMGCIMKKMNVIVVFDNTLENTLMCKRTKEPYMGMYNLVGGKKMMD